MARARIATLALASALLITAVSATAATAAREHRVPWTVAAALEAQARHPDSPPPGANDWDCEPRRHRQPVVLVHGLLANQTVNWRTIAPFLANRGFCVFSLTYGTKRRVQTPLYQPGGLRRMQASARELRSFVNRVRHRTDARRVDIVGHSEGSLMPDWYVRILGGARRVDDYVGLTTLWEGTNTAGLASANDLAVTLGLGPALRVGIDRACSSCRQFLQGSRFLKRLHARGIVSPRVDYTNIVTKNDELVIPYTSGLLPGPNVTNVVLQDECALDQAEHLAVAFDPVTAGFVWRALDRKRATKPPCVPVLPGIGAPGYSGS